MYFILGTFTEREQSVVLTQFVPQALVRSHVLFYAVYKIESDVGLHELVIYRQ
jgi:hypothetical protein